MVSESPGTIVLPTSEIGRFAMFTAALAGTRQPADTHLVVMASASVVENLNSALRQLRPDDNWAWIIGDDHVWQPECLTQLLAAMDDNLDADILVPLVTKRNPPWHLVLFRETGLVEDDLPKWAPLPWEEIPEHGMFEVDAAGSAGMLIRREVLDVLGDPWFENSGRVVLNEDVMFCRRAREAGFRIFATADVVMGHLGIFNVRPMRKDGRWGALTEFSTPEQQFRNLFMPPLEDLEAAVSGR